MPGAGSRILYHGLGTFEMKQLLQSVKTGEVSLAEVPVPSAAPGRVLVRVRASAVSVGTERRISDFAQKGLLSKARSRPDLVRQALAKLKKDGPLALWESISERLEQPIPVGYSCAGIVVESGEGVVGFTAGDRVACAGVGYANHAEFVAVPDNLCVRLPDPVSFEDAAFTAIAACALHGLRLGRPQLGESVAVIGLGLLGQFSVQLAKASGLCVLAVDLDEERLELARRLGAERAVPRAGAEAAAAAFTRGRGADIVLIAADTESNDPVELAGAVAKDRGVVISIGTVGMTVPRPVYFRKELEFKVSRSYGPGRYDPLYEEGGVDYPYGFVRWTEGRNMEEVVRLMANGALRLEPMLTHRLSLADWSKVQPLIQGKSGERCLGVVLGYGADAPLAKKVVLDGAPASPGKLRAGVLGAGAFASAVMLPILRRSGAELRGIAGASGARAAAAARRFGFAFAASEAAEVLADKDATAVLILTRHNLHAEQTSAALAAGKHVFVEKPLCMSLEELESIERAKSGAPGKLVAVGFNRRFAPFTRAIQEHFHEAAGPKLVSIRVNAGRLPEGHWILDPAEGGGRLIGEGCHFIDWANAVIGETPESADCRPLGRAPGEQDWTLRLAYPGGSLAEIVYLSDGAGALGKERYEVHGGGRSAVLEDFRSLRLYSSGASRAKRSWLRSDKGHAALWQAFCAAVESGGPVPIPWDAIQGTMRAVFAARKSLGSGRAEPLLG